MPREQKITFGEMRRSGATKILVHCVCGRAIEMDASDWPDDMHLSDIEPRFNLPGLRPPRRWRPTKLRAGKKGHLMKYTSPRPFADPEKAASRILEIANSVEPAQAHPHREINEPFLCNCATPPPVANDASRGGYDKLADHCADWQANPQLGTAECDA